MGSPRVLPRHELSSARVETRGDQKIAAALADRGGTVVKERDEFIGPSLGDELKRKALIALGLALAAQLIYLAVRFR